MPWKVTKPMDERIQFISKLLEGDKMVDLCREFGISRKTGYKFLERYKSGGFLGLNDLVKRPLNIPHRTPDQIEKLVLKLRKLKPTWGPKKLKVRLEKLHPGIDIPAASTIGDILKRNGYIELKQRRRKKNYFPSDLTASRSPNEVWCIDFKGQFRLGNGKYCYPLTITDHYSRFLIACEALEDTKTESVFPVFEAIFQKYGMPKIIRSDNGVPFSSVGLAGMSRLSTWFIRLGIRPERIEPGHPEQNGRHERMHRTLKADATRPAARNILQQQERFDKFQKSYNTERPHEALEMETPSSWYKPSQYKYPDELPTPDYSTFDVVRHVMKTGTIRVPKSDKRCFITRALFGHPVGMRELAKDVWAVSFSDLDLGFISKADHHFLLTLDNPLIRTDSEL
jgi:transposase InsO family protein